MLFGRLPRRVERGLPHRSRSVTSMCSVRKGVQIQQGRAKLVVPI